MKEDAFNNVKANPFDSIAVDRDLVNSKRDIKAKACMQQSMSSKAILWLLVIFH